MNKKITAAIIVIVLIAAAAIFWPRAPRIAGALNCQSSTCLSGGLELTDSSLQIDSGVFSSGGLTETFVSKALSTNTNVVCSIQSPSSTSTIAGSPTITLLTSSTTASVVDIAKAATPTATTTNIGSSAVAANAQATITASSTASGGLNVMAPSTYINFAMKGGTGTFSPTGLCSVVFRSAI